MYTSGRVRPEIELGYTPRTRLAPVEHSIAHEGNVWPHPGQQSPFPLRSRRQITAAPYNSGESTASGRQRPPFLASSVRELTGGAPLAWDPDGVDNREGERDDFIVQTTTTTTVTIWQRVTTAWRGALLVMAFRRSSSPVGRPPVLQETRSHILPSRQYNQTHPCELTECDQSRFPHQTISTGRSRWPTDSLCSPSSVEYSPP